MLSDVLDSSGERVPLLTLPRGIETSNCAARISGRTYDVWSRAGGSDRGGPTCGGDGA
jgi:hypothetical protein